MLQIEPRLHVPGMTEFDLGGGTVLGLMPEASIVRLLGPAFPDPASANGVPRAELYIVRSDAAECLNRALASGGRLISGFTLRDWGHVAGYVYDPDNHVVAFAVDAAGTIND